MVDLGTVADWFTAFGTSALAYVTVREGRRADKRESDARDIAQKERDKLQLRQEDDSARTVNVRIDPAPTMGRPPERKLTIEWPSSYFIMGFEFHEFMLTRGDSQIWAETQRQLVQSRSSGLAEVLWCNKPNALDERWIIFFTNQQGARYAIYGDRNGMQRTGRALHGEIPDEVRQRFESEIQGRS